jgi:hypothetical protein
MLGCCCDALVTTDPLLTAKQGQTHSAAHAHTRALLHTGKRSPRAPRLRRSSDLCRCPRTEWFGYQRHPVEPGGATYTHKKHENRKLSNGAKEGGTEGHQKVGAGCFTSHASPQHRAHRHHSTRLTSCTKANTLTCTLARMENTEVQPEVQDANTPM